MAQDNSLYVVDVYMANEGEPESTLELTVLRCYDPNKRPQVYVHTYVQPQCNPEHIRWKEAAKKGLPRELFTLNRWPSLTDLIAADYLKDKYVVCFCAAYEPLQSFMANSRTKGSILSLWQEVFAGNDDACALTHPKQMLSYMGLPDKDSSNTNYTPLMKRVHALLAIWLYLRSCRRLHLQPAFGEGDGIGDYERFWPLPDVPRPWYDPEVQLLRQIPADSLCEYFSDRLPDYLDWSSISIYRDDWVFGRELHSEVKLMRQDLMLDFIVNTLFPLQTRLMVLSFYAIYLKRTDYARTIALHDASFGTLPQAVKEDFSQFVIIHLDDFLTSAQKQMIISALVSQLLQWRLSTPQDNFDFEEMKKNEAESGLTFVRETIPSNHNIACFKEIRNQEEVLYRCFIIQGNDKERDECVDFINEKIKELFAEAYNPFSTCWVSPDLRRWLCYITGFEWRELAGNPRPSDNDTLRRTRQAIAAIIKKEGKRYLKAFNSNFDKMVTYINDNFDCTDKSKFRFAFQGITYELIIDQSTDDMSLWSRLWHHPL